MTGYNSLSSKIDVLYGLISFVVSTLVGAHPSKSNSLLKILDLKRSASLTSF
jgi:hypothetical protein